MASFLILRLVGPMQGWSGHSYEGQRPLVEYPTRSGVLGLLAACLGIDRNDAQGQFALSQSLGHAVRADARRYVPHALVDYHTVLDARESYQGLKSHETIQTWRGYQCDAAFTVALWLRVDARWSLEQIAQATRTPRYTPFLGRRSCPITRPLFDRMIDADNALFALATVEPMPCFGNVEHSTVTDRPTSTVYSEEAFTVLPGNIRRQYSKEVRDEPFGLQVRQFARRWVHVYTSHGGADVPQ
jgi:CRISPR system Cascade subunit CasD